MVESVAEIKARYDVLVVGGGVAGINAAVAAARNGASVFAAAMASSKGYSISEVSEYTVKTMNKFPR